MSEWDIVLVLSVLIGMVVTIVAPIISLTKSITKLNHLVDRIYEDFKEFKEKSSETHGRIWRHNEEQDKKITDHEKRIYLLERKDNK